MMPNRMAVFATLDPAGKFPDASPTFWAAADIEPPAQRGGVFPPARCCRLGWQCSRRTARP
jgi:hypothetical protein